MRRTVARSITLLAGLLLVGACSVGQPPPAAEKSPVATVETASAGTVVWNLPTSFAPSEYQLDILQKFVAKVKERSNDRLEIRIHHSSSLYNTFQIPLALIDGRAEIGSFSTSGISDAFPHLSVADLPYVSSSEDEGRKILEALAPYHKREVEKLGLLHLMTLPWPAQNVFTTKDPVRTVEDWKGMKIRTYSVESADFIRSMGASPITVPNAELYVAMQRGLAEGAMTATITMRSSKSHELMRYANLWTSSGSLTELIVVNKKHYDALSADLKKILTDVVVEERLQDETWPRHRSANAEALQFITQNGVQSVEVSPAEKARAKEIAKRTVWQNWLKRAGPVGEEALRVAEQAVAR